MAEPRTRVRQEMERLEVRPFTLQDFHTRRDRRRRNERIAAGIVGVSVFVAAIWLVTSGAPDDRARTPGSSGPALTGPAVWPDYPGQVGLVGLAPADLPPSTPATGELVLSFFFGHTDGDSGSYHLDLYADGRLIREKLGEDYAGGDVSPTGKVEQRLTPEGVEMMLAEVLSTGLFGEDRHFGGYAPGLHFGRVRVEVFDGDRSVNLTWGDIGTTAGPYATPTPDQADALLRLDRRLEDLSWLPASAWEDREYRPFVPSRYSLCLETQDVSVELAQALASLPRPAEDLVRGLDLSFSDESYAEGRYWCSAVTADRARALAGILDEEGARISEENVWGVIYTVGLDGSSLMVSVSFAPLLPDAP